MSSSTRINVHILVVQYGNSRTVSLLWFAVPWGLIVPSFLSLLGYDLGMRLAIQYGAVYWIQWIPYSKCLTLLNSERYFQESSFPDHSHFKVYGVFFHCKKLVVSPSQWVPGCRYSGYVHLVLETNYKRQPERKPDQIIHNLNCINIWRSWIYLSSPNSPYHAYMQQLWKCNCRNSLTPAGTCQCILNYYGWKTTTSYPIALWLVCASTHILESASSVVDLCNYSDGPASSLVDLCNYSPQSTNTKWSLPLCLSG